MNVLSFYALVWATLVMLQASVFAAPDPGAKPNFIVILRSEHPPWVGQFAKNNHIAPADDIGMETPQLYNLEQDPGENTDVTAKHPELVKRLLAVAEKARQDIGDHDRVGANMRFFDPMNERPTEPSTAFGKPKKR